MLSKDKSVFFLLVAVFVLYCDLLGAVAKPGMADPAIYPDELIQRAMRMKLYDDPYWHTLLHYKWTMTGKKSLIDDPKFFLSPKGKRSPKNELEATLRALFNEPLQGQKSIPCRFPARYSWLIKRLSIDENKIPRKECAELNELVKNMKPVSAALIFPTFNINNPASMFGHTFISIDTETKSKLLSYAVNYSAITGDRVGPFYALLGVFGFYRGYFSSLPYYAKVAEYNDFDFRDIWEYPLVFTKEEVVRIIMHIVELDSVYSDYFFFDENCSYNLLFLFDIARPGLALTDNRGLWVIPVDTMRRAEKNGLLKGIQYRPSRVTKIRYIASALSAGGQKTAISLVRGTRKPGEVLKATIPKDEKIRIFDLAAEYLKYHYSKGRVDRSVYQEKLISLLGARSGLGTKEEKVGEDPGISVPADPLQGHRSNRLMAGAGFKDGQAFQELRYRPAYHTLLDPDEGYLEGAQIIFTDVAVRYYSERRKPVFQGLDVVDIRSISPIDRFFKSFSWKIKTGVYRKDVEIDRSILTYGLIMGGGVAWRIGRPLLVYLLAEPDVFLAPEIDDRYAAGMGGSAGLMLNISPFWKTHLAGRAVDYFLGDSHAVVDLSMEHSFRLSQNNTIFIEVKRYYSYDFVQMHYALGWNIFF